MAMKRLAEYRMIDDHTPFLRLGIGRRDRSIYTGGAVTLSHAAANEFYRSMERSL